MEIIIRIVQLLLALSILVFIHELGHFFFARLFGVRVNKFYLFFDLKGKALLKYKPKNSDTEYGIGWLPLGGYCSMAGMIDERFDAEGMESPPEKWEFRSKPVWQRFFIMIGGVLFNVLLAMLIYGGIAYQWGSDHLPMKNIGNHLTYTSVGHAMGLKDGDLPVAVDGKPIKYYDGLLIQTIAEGEELTVLRDENHQIEQLPIPIDLVEATLATDSAFCSLTLPAIIEQVIEESVAQKAGLTPGDEILAIGDTPVNGLQEILPLIQASKGKSIEMSVKREENREIVTVTPDSIKGLGVIFQDPSKVFGIEHKEYTLLESIPAGIKQATQQIGSYVGQLKYIATKEGATKIGGFGTMGKLFPSSWDWYSFWRITAFFSIILAVMNILPIPMLDGGHIFFLLIEMIRRKPLSIETQTKLQIVGLFIVLTLVIYANALDIFRFFWQ